MHVHAQTLGARQTRTAASPKACRMLALFVIACSEIAFAQPAEPTVDFDEAFADLSHELQQEEPDLFQGIDTSSPRIATKGRQFGIASFYGKRFAGRLTANGERFDPRKLTAAHRTLPFGSKVRVTNRRNGKSVVVRINDRGPFHPNRDIDLSRKAAERIGLIDQGIGPVQIAPLEN